MAADKPIAEIRGLSVTFETRFGVVHAVQDVSFSVARGETLAILGESGSGKSVSAAAFMGLIDSPPGFIESGELLFDGVDLRKIDENARREINGRRVAMVFQDTLAGLNPVYSVGWQIAEAFRAHGMRSKEAGEKALELMKRVGIPNAETRSRDYPHQFSGGQRQRVMIAMALAWKPDLLIADEPTSALDVTVQAGILKLLKELQTEFGMALILITHDIGIVEDIADRICVMHKGRVVETGTVAEVLGSPKDAYTRKLIAAVPGRGTVPQVPATRSGSPLLVVRDLSKYYQLSPGFFGDRPSHQFKALDGVSFDVWKGETVGIVGESGSGKSTLVRTLLGLETASGGSVTCAGTEIIGLSDRELLDYRRRVQVVFQDPKASLNPRMNVGQIISEAWIVHQGVLARERWPARVAELLEQVGLDPQHAQRYPHQFSGGQQQRIAIARALALQPELIVCDEAVSALDVSVQAQIVALLRRLQDDYGLSYIFVAHDLPVIHDFANKVIVMKAGKIVEQGDTAQIFGNPQHEYTRNLLASSPASHRSFGSSPELA